jgi:ribosomal protein S18 acetylase RimI-like enzyme
MGVPNARHQCPAAGEPLVPRAWRSVGLQTDLELAATRGSVTDRDDYSVVATPDDPTYFTGNQLVLPAPPQVGEVAYWTRKFAAELGTDPEIRHVALRWDGIAGDAGARGELEAAGFTIDTSVVMSAPRIAAPSTMFEIRPLAVREMQSTAELAFAVGDQHDETMRTFLARRAAWQQALVGAGTAMWWGAFDRGALVGSLGIVALGARARYQDVQTASTHRKRGIASALLVAAANALLPSVTQLVIVAEPKSAAQRVYERAGFTAIETVVSACRYPARD